MNFNKINDELLCNIFSNTLWNHETIYELRSTDAYLQSISKTLYACYKQWMDDGLKQHSQNFAEDLLVSVSDLLKDESSNVV